MDISQFNGIVDTRIQKIKEVLQTKGAEYGSIDRLHNFRVAGRIKNETPLKAAWGMFMKHLVCIYDMVEGHSDITPYMIDEKIGDAINYLVIMEAICIEEMGRIQRIKEAIK
jgi:hypothetical protein